MATGEVQDIEITLAESARNSRVKVNGESVRAFRCVVTTDIHDVATTIELHYYGPRNEPIVVKGRMVVEEYEDGERLPAERHDGTPITCSKCGLQVDEVTNFQSPNKQYARTACTCA